MRRYINADKLMELANNTKDKTIDANDIARFPAADVVEVTRCKDCKHYAGEGMYCACDIMVHYDNFYCYWGEREEA